MKLNLRITMAVASLMLPGFLDIPGRAQPQVGVQGGGRGKGKGSGAFGMTPRDTRAKCPTYKFDEANPKMPYCVFVSSKVKKDKPAPLIVMLHGLGAGPGVMMTKTSIDLAEKGGYVVVAPLGYSTNSWFGSPWQPISAGMPENLAELSEKDVFNVIDLVQAKYKIDANRMYVMGHSMGGAGAVFLGAKHASMWAAIAAEAPAMNGNRVGVLRTIKDAGVPVMIVQGDMDELVPLESARQWTPTAKELQMDLEYVEQRGIGHGAVIDSGMKPIYEFFGKHSKK